MAFNLLRGWGIISNNLNVFSEPLQFLVQDFFLKLSSPDRGVVIGGSENEKSRRKRLIDSEMAGPIAMKLSGIDRGNSVTVLGQRN